MNYWTLLSVVVGTLLYHAGKSVAVALWRRHRKGDGTYIDVSSPVPGVPPTFICEIPHETVDEETACESRRLRLKLIERVGRKK